MTGEDAKALALNANHSHFIFFDSKLECKFGAEINCRINLEKELQKSSLCIQLVFNGGFLTLLGIESSLAFGIPIIILEVRFFNEFFLSQNFKIINF